MKVRPRPVRPTAAQTHAAMTAFARRHPTALLADTLEAFAGLQRPTDHDRLNRSIVICVLIERHPEVHAAFDQWTRAGYRPGVTPDAVVIAAARNSRPVLPACYAPKSLP